MLTNAHIAACEKLHFSAYVRSKDTKVKLHSSPQYPFFAVRLPFPAAT